MQPKVLTTTENFNNLMAMKVFQETCEQWCVENKNFRYTVTMKTMYFDYGQNWKYTGFLTTDEDGGNSWQSLCPRDWELVVTTNDIDKLIDMAWYYMDKVASGKICVSLYEKFE